MSTIQDLVQWIVDAEQKVQTCNKENDELRAQLAKQRERNIELQDQLARHTLVVEEDVNTPPDA